MLMPFFWKTFRYRSYQFCFLPLTARLCSLTTKEAQFVFIIAEGMGTAMSRLYPRDV